MLCGSATELTWEQDNLDATIQGWYPGAQGGKAIAKLLFGEASPEGKLPITFYHSAEELPEFTDYGMKGRTYRYMEQEALYPLGYGLSYTSFAVQNVKLSADEITKAGISIEADITNTGCFDGAETVQVYVKVEKPDTPNAQLKALKKVFLQKGETKHVELTLTDTDFALYDEEGKLVVSEGTCKIYIGTCQPDSRSASLTGWIPVVYEVSSANTYVAEE